MSKVPVALAVSPANFLTSGGLHSCNLACGFNLYDAAAGAGECAGLLATGMTCAEYFSAGMEYQG
eukprot:COSAG02_NODE_10632_length_1894_cov_1.656825_2_plen_65_part_00